MATGFFLGCVFFLFFVPLIALEVQRGSWYKLSDIIPSSIKGSIFGVVCWGRPQIQCLDSKKTLSSPVIPCYPMHYLTYTSPYLGCFLPFHCFFPVGARVFRILFGFIGKCACVYFPFNCPLRFRCAIIFLGEFTTQHKVLPPKKKAIPQGFQTISNFTPTISQVSGQVSINLQKFATKHPAKLQHFWGLDGSLSSVTRADLDFDCWSTLRIHRFTCFQPIVLHPTWWGLTVRHGIDGP